MFIKSVWMHRRNLGRSPDDVSEVLSNLEKHGFTSAFLFVKGHDSDVIYPTKLEDAKYVMENWGGGEDPLKRTVEIAHDYGIQLHATFVVFCEGRWRGKDKPSQPGWWLSKHEDLAQISRDGEKILRWADPAKEEVRGHEKDLILDLVKRYDVDGVQLDYIRYPEEAEGCFCKHCRSLFRRLHGVDPKLHSEPDQKLSLWIRWRAWNITSFVKELRREMRMLKPEMKLSAAVFKDYPRCLITVGQDWPLWIEDGIIDFVCPMTYEYDVRVARYLARNHRAAAGEDAVIYEGLGKRSSQSILSPEEVRIQAEVFKEEGADGIVIFSLSSLTDGDFKELDRI